ncbi:MAG: peptidylprolyl isomerase, partial [Myxococcota bacterium]
NITEDEINRAIQDILRTNKISEAELQAAIDARNMSMSQYREDLKSQLIRLKLIDQKVRSRVVIPEAEIKSEFERQTRDEAKDEMVKIRHIFLRWGESPDPTERTRVMAKAKDARQRVIKGEAFDAVARALSEGPTAATGGDLGEMSRQQMLPELARGIKGVKVGELSNPIETDSGVHVVLVEARREKGSSSYAEARNAIYQKLYQREVEAQMKVWLEELRKQAAVSIML